LCTTATRRSAFTPFTDGTINFALPVQTIKQDRKTFVAMFFQLLEQGWTSYVVPKRWCETIVYG
jgi:hypothetical protein